MKIAATSDLHGFLPNIEPCDILLIAGDIAPIRFDRNITKCVKWFRGDFSKWVECIPANHIVLTPGNHDFALWELWKDSRDLNSLWPKKCKAVIDTEITIDGLRIFASPWVSGLPGWAFNMNEEALALHLEKMLPQECDIVITHAAPKIGSLGKVLQRGRNHGSNFGSAAISSALVLVKTRYAFCGHIHSGDHGEVDNGRAILSNVSLVDERYSPVYDVKYFDINTTTSNENNRRSNRPSDTKILGKISR